VLLSKRARISNNDIKVDKKKRRNTVRECQTKLISLINQIDSGKMYSMQIIYINKQAFLCRQM
jgi:hypothetical protein